MAVAQQVLITMVDDIDGTEEGVDTVRFGLDGQDYEIDLNAGRQEKLREFLAPYVEHARSAARASRQAATVRRRGRPVGQPDPIAVRTWAKGQGIKVNDRGRVPVEITEQFKAAHA